MVECTSVCVCVCVCVCMYVSRWDRVADYLIVKLI